MFEWDEAKRLATLEKHGIDFVRAAEVFSTPHVVLPGRSDIETRQVKAEHIEVPHYLLHIIMCEGPGTKTDQCRFYCDLLRWRRYTGGAGGQGVSGC